MRRITSLAAGLFLCGCAHPVDLFVIDPQSGEVAATQINAAQTSGPIALEFHGDYYVGTWVSVRDTGYQSTGLAFTGRYFVSTASTSEADAGNAVANLRSASGNTLRCQFRYGFNQGVLTVTVTGFGQCIDQDGRMYDVQGTSTAVASRLDPLRAAAPPTGQALNGGSRAFPPVTSSGGR